MTVFGNRDFAPANPRTRSHGAATPEQRPDSASTATATVTTDPEHAVRRDDHTDVVVLDDDAGWPGEVTVAANHQTDGRSDTVSRHDEPLDVDVEPELERALDAVPEEWTRAAQAPARHAAEEPMGAADDADLPPVVALPGALDVRRVVLKLRGGEEIEVDRAEGREPAIRRARDLIAHIETAQREERWPELGDRFIRPDAIISIDVQRSE